ncbi:MAG: divalent-cation tolerance protein CutA [Deltaproteobacteria bacterium]|nr:divalent-cation tolerance protein CutA [Deltaproteobacteria bacterium]
MAPSDALVILCTAPNSDVGARLARGLVEAELAACVNLIAGVRSFYRWKGKVEDESEVQLVVKTRASRFDEVRAWVEENHPYDTPEILALPVSGGSDAYLAWVGEQVPG